MTSMSFLTCSSLAEEELRGSFGFVGESATTKSRFLAVFVTGKRHLRRTLHLEFYRRGNTPCRPKAHSISSCKTAHPSWGRRLKKGRPVSSRTPLKRL